MKEESVLEKEGLGEIDAREEAFWRTCKSFFQAGDLVGPEARKEGGIGGRVERGVEYTKLTPGIRIRAGWQKGVGRSRLALRTTREGLRCCSDAFVHTQAHIDTQTRKHTHTHTQTTHKHTHKHT